MSSSLNPVDSNDTSENGYGNEHVAVLSLHTSPFVQPGHGDSGGMNVYIRELVSSLAHSGAMCSVYVRRWRKDLPDKVMIEPGVRLVHIDAGDPELAKEELPEVVDDFSEGVERDLLLGPKADVLHANYWLSGVSGHDLKHRLGLPLITTFHTLGKSKIFSGEFEASVRVKKEQEIIDCSDIVVANSTAEANQLEEFYGAPEERIAVVPLGVEHALFAPGNQDAARSAIGISNGPVVMYVGRLQPLKGAGLALEMFSELQTETGVLLIIGGASGVHGDKEVRELKQTAKELGIEKQVRFIPPQPHHILSTYYRASDLVVVPSKSESFGLVALEAAACGTPVIAASVGGLQDLVIHGITGYLLDKRDPKLYAHYARQILENPLQGAEMAMSAAEKAKQYAWAKTSEQMLNLYSSVSSRALVDCQ